MGKKKVIILSLSILIVISIIVAITTAYFSSKQNVGGLITLKELDFSIYGDMEDNVVVMPGDTIDVNCYVINSRDVDGNDYDNLAEIYVRFSLNLVSENTNLTFDILQDSEDFVFLNDTCYYINKINAGDMVNIIKQIKFPTTISNDFNNKNIYFELSVDAIQATDDAIMDLWPDFYQYLKNK